MVLNTVNGAPIDSMEHLVRQVRTAKTEFLRFRFDGQAGLTTGTEMVLETAMVRDSMPEILAMHRIASEVSENLQHLLE